MAGKTPKQLVLDPVNVSPRIRAIVRNGLPGKIPSMAKSAVSRYDNYIDGRWTPSRSPATFENRNPANLDDLIGIFPDSSTDEAIAAVAAARRAYDGWRLVPAPKRAEILFRAAQALVHHKETFAGEMTRVCAASRTHFTRRPRADRPGETAPVDVDEITDMLVEFADGATGTLQTSWLAGGHKMDIGFAVHGTRGSVEFTSEEPTEVRLYKTSDPAAESGFRSIPVGPAHPGAELFWPVPGMALGFDDGFIIAVRDLLRAIAEGGSAGPDFLDGLRASEVVAAAQASAATRSWQPVERLEVQEGLELA